MSEDGPKTLDGHILNDLKSKEAQIAELELKGHQYERDLRSKDEELQRMTNQKDDYYGRWVSSLRAYVFWFLLLGSALTVGGYALLIPNGTNEYCYIEHKTRVRDGQGNTICSTEHWTLNGYRWMREDRDIGSFKSIDEAKEAAAKLGCPIK